MDEGSGQQQSFTGTRRIALFSKHDPWIIVIGMAVLLATFVLILFIPNRQGGRGFNHPDQVAYALGLAAFFSLLVIFSLKETKRIRDTFFVWDSQRMLLERQGKVEWELPWTEYVGLKRAPNSKGKLTIHIETTDKERLIDLGILESVKVGSQRVMRLLVLLAQSPEHCLINLPKPHRPMNRKLIVALLVFGAVGLVAGIPGLIKAQQAIHGLVTAEISSTEAFVSCGGIILGLLSLLAGFDGLKSNRKAQKESTSILRDEVPIWNLADTISYGLVRPGIHSDTEYEAIPEFGRFIRNTKNFMLFFAVLMAVVSLSMAISGLNHPDAFTIGMSFLIAVFFAFSSVVFAIQFHQTNLAEQNNGSIVTIKEGQVRIENQDGISRTYEISNPKILTQNLQSIFSCLSLSSDNLKTSIIPALYIPRQVAPQPEDL